MGKINAKKTIADPGSGWRVIKIIGISIIRKTIIISLNLLRSVWMMLKNFAKKIAVHNLLNSVGWKLIGPIINQDFAPPLSTPNKKRPKSVKIENKYTNSAELSKNLYFVKIIKKNDTRDNPRNNNCFPIRVVKSNIVVSDSV